MLEHKLQVNRRLSIGQIVKVGDLAENAKANRRSAGEHRRATQSDGRVTHNH